ncbi:hypothetical protein SLINC_8300 [Streptomyces lincolnensis]|uniref:Cupin type-1 domain-containing protein n=1 Tax=Streptomyces lincolnensis TaxID=1915 RepID=A0A1B1MPM7_STRLN|nr:cupin domain-containing protein [Streptomyces lincolnensis]ANS70524.1 hypothetical protein SLINC_8300 [Streptomyces lincolnensis]
MASQQHNGSLYTGQEGILPPEGVYRDARGEIINLPPFPTVGVLVINSRRTAVRGNHWHANESHLMYVASGRMLYIEEDENGELFTLEMGSQDAVVSPRGRAHCTVFLEDSVIVVLSDADRTGRRYEDEVVRVPPLNERLDLSRYGLGR